MNRGPRLHTVCSSHCEWGPEQEREPGRVARRNTRTGALHIRTHTLYTYYTFYYFKLEMSISNFTCFLNFC